MPCVYKQQHTWSYRAPKAPVKVRCTSTSYPFITNHHTELHHVEKHGEFEIYIDVAAIIADAISRCRNTRTGKSRLLGGIITAKRLSVREVSRRVEALPIPAGYEPVEEKDPA